MIIQCACCGSDVTKPQFHNGLAYGYTCIKKVAPSQKRTSIVYVQADSFEMLDGAMKPLKFVLDGKKYLTRKALGHPEGIFVGVIMTKDNKCLVNVEYWKKK